MALAKWVYGGGWRLLMERKILEKFFVNMRRLLFNII